MKPVSRLAGGLVRLSSRGSGTSPASKRHLPKTNLNCSWSVYFNDKPRFFQTLFVIKVIQGVIRCESSEQDETGAQASSLAVIATTRARYLQAGRLRSSHRMRDSHI